MDTMLLTRNEVKVDENKSLFKDSKTIINLTHKEEKVFITVISEDKVTEKETKALIDYAEELKKQYIPAILRKIFHIEVQLYSFSENAFELDNSIIIG